MNMRRHTGSRLEQDLASKLRELLGGIRWLHDWRVEHVGSKPDARFDLVATLPLPGGDVTLYVECKGEMRPSTFHNLIVREIPPSGRGSVAIPVLAMPFVSPRFADLCNQHGWSWYDLAGNCHFDVPGVIYIEQRGLEPVHRVPRPRANMGPRKQDG